MHHALITFGKPLYNFFLINIQHYLNSNLHTKPCYDSHKSVKDFLFDPLLEISFVT